MARVYSIFAVIMFVVLLSALFMPWVEGRNSSFSISDILLNLDQINEANQFFESISQFMSAAKIQDIINMMALSSILLILGIIVSLTGIKFKSALPIAAAFAFLTGIVFVVAFNNLINLISDMMGPLAIAVKSSIKYSYGLFFTFIAGGIGIIGYIIPQKEKET